VGFEAHAQAVGSDGLGVYAVIPAAVSSTSTFGEIELGGIYAEPVWSGLDMVARAGVALPTGSAGLDAEAVNAIASTPRLGDAVLGYPDTTAARLGLSPLWHRGRWFARGDLGLDIPLKPAANITFGAPLLRLDAGVGIDLGSVVLSAELANVLVFRDFVDNSAGPGLPQRTAWYDTAAIGARLRFGTVEPYAAVIVPLEQDSASYFDVAFTLGLDLHFR
jgi:hypothetical protein